MSLVTKVSSVLGHPLRGLQVAVASVAPGWLVRDADGVL